MSSPNIDDMVRADNIVQWSIRTGRNPFDTAGIGSSDEEWMGQNPEWNEYIESEIILKKNQAKKKAEAKPAKKTMKKVTHKYPYPDKFLKKDGTLKKTNKKERLQWIKEYESGQQKEEPKIDPFNDESEQENWSECHDCGNPLYLGEHVDFVGEEYIGIEDDDILKCKYCHTGPYYPDYNPELDYNYSELDVDIEKYYRDNFVFDQEPYLTAQTCKRIRDYCELFPKTCYLNRDFLDNYIKLCQVIVKTDLYIDRFYERLPEDRYVIDDDGMLRGNELERYAKRGPPNSLPWRHFIYEESRGLIPIRAESIYDIIQQRIPKSQIPQQAKDILLQTIGNIPELSGGIVLDRRRAQLNRSHLVQVYRNSIIKFVLALARNRDLMELFINTWREGLIKNTSYNYKQIEDIIRRFIKNL